MTQDKSYDIHPDFAKFPAMSLRFNAAIIALLNILLRVTRLRRKHLATVKQSHRRITGQGGHTIKLDVFTPEAVESGAPVLVYYHGGAFALTFGGLHLENAERYAQETGCVTVFVRYRLAMRHPFPDGFNDAYTALCWVNDNAETLGVDPGRIAVGGDSAGGALAAGVAQKANDEGRIKLCGQMLVYPVLDNRCDTPSATEFIDVPLWNGISNRRMWAMYLRRYPEAELPEYAAPGRVDPGEGLLQNVPPAYIETAEFDPLRDEGLAYARALTEAGHHPVLNETSGTIHGYDAVADSQIVIAAMAQRMAFLKSVFNASTRDAPNE